MFTKLFSKKKLQVIAPITGEVVSLKEVPDPVFSEGMMGEGIAIIPQEGGIHSPVEGTIILVADTSHAIGIQATDGTEILIHIGLETVTLKGEGFKTHVQVGDAVSIGQLLIEADWDYLNEHAKSILTPVIITNSSSRNIKSSTITQCIANETVLLTISTQ